jgi:hypothetical protein
MGYVVEKRRRKNASGVKEILSSKTIKNPYLEKF